MTRSYRKLLFDDPNYMISNVSKFLGDVSTDHGMARRNLEKVSQNIAAFEAAIAGHTWDEEGLADIKYATTKIQTHLELPQAGFTDKDADIFVQFLHFRYAELIEMANELDAKMTE